MHISYIISAYKNPTQLVRLVRRLNFDTTSFYLHIDKRSPSVVYDVVREQLGNLPNVHLLSRHSCHWGGFGHVQATLKGIRTIFDTQTAPDFVVLLTGQDYPIKSNDQIQAFFQQNKGKSFIEYFPLPDKSWRNGGIDRIERWHIHYRSRHFVFPRKRSSIVRRHFPAGFQPYGGSGYWCLSRECAVLIHDFVQLHPGFVNFFRYVNIPDEIMFQTILLNSRYKDRIVNDNLRFIEWSGPNTRSPAVLCKEDFEKLTHSPKLYARKFDVNIDADVLDRLDSVIGL